MEYAGYIGKVKVRAAQPFIVYGRKAGLVSVHPTLEAARTFCEFEHTRRQQRCAATDALIYEWREGKGWKAVVLGVGV